MGKAENIDDCDCNSGALERAWQREKAARKHAEQLLDDKSRELYTANLDLQKQYDVLQHYATELELLHQIASVNQKDAPIDEVLGTFVGAVCEKCGWQVGHLLKPDPDDPDTLKSSGLWHIEDPARYAEFRRISEGQRFVRGQGLPGGVWGSGQSMWSRDVQFEEGYTCPRAPVARAIGVAGGFAVPIRVFGKTVAVAEFFADNPQHRDEHFSRLVVTAAMQLSLALERQQSQTKLRRNYQQLQHTLQELQQTQDQLLQSEKLASLGQMAAGVAHEINNPMGFITSNLGSLREYFAGYRETLDCARQATTALQRDDVAHARSLSERAEQLYAEHDLEFVGEDIEELLGDSLDGAQRVRDIVNGLRNFSRVDNDAQDSIDLNDCIRDALKIAHVEIKSSADVTCELGELPKVTGSAGQIDQVLINLLVNAAQAIEGEGQITVRSGINEDGEVTVAISDNGKGIAEEDRDKLFTPFFTTKPVGTGTGLGLSISYGIVQKHGGRIEVESSVGLGTTFTVILPAAG